MSQYPIKSGLLLISEPFLADPNFERGVVLICEHNQTGTVGLMLNKPTGLSFNELVEDGINFNMPLNIGGPVEQNTLHFLHNGTAQIPGTIKLIEGLYWGGDFEVVKQLVAENQLTDKDIKFYLGYSGWSAGQLSQELDQKSWYLKKTSANEVFEVPQQALWRTVLHSMGEQFKMISNYPVDPRLN